MAIKNPPPRPMSPIKVVPGTPGPKIVSRPKPKPARPSGQR
jgi:hypothetical protein